MGPFKKSEIAAALVAGGITGTHRSHPRGKNLEKIFSLLEGEEDAFGISGLGRYSAAEILGFMGRIFGCSSDIADLGCEETIEPQLTVAGLVAAGRRLRRGAEAGELLLAATGHPTGLLHHHIRVVEAYRSAGGKILQLREDEDLGIGRRGGRAEVRYVGGVGCLADWGSLKHTHSATPMEALLEAAPWPDLVLADHGFAGAAIERGIPTIAIADINDHPLAVPWAEGKDIILVPMDDNRPPRLYEPAWRAIEHLLEGGVLDEDP
ncbi:MAG: phosphatase [Actinomycetota bacterium]